MKRILGIELGSTRIKSVLIDENAVVIAQGGYDWENILVDGLWSYDMDEVWHGLQVSFAHLAEDYGQPITKLDSIGISAMMHGYLAFDAQDHLLAPFRTWRNTNTAQAAAELSELFQFNIPMRWSVSQYYQSVLEKLPHVHDVAFLTTLAGYVHYRLTGRKVLGIGDASGMFPIDDEKRFNPSMLRDFDALLARHGVGKRFESILPEILLAGQPAGNLTAEGALLLDPSGTLQAGAPLCPPEGDMGTGMVCTNCVAEKTANVSLGTSANLTVILEKNLSSYYPEIDVITTPDGAPAALVHTNTCTSVINTWVSLFDEVIRLAGGSIDRGELFGKLFNKALESDERVGNVVGYNYLAGEPIARVLSGRPMLFNLPDGNLNLANFMQTQIYSAIATVELGMDILRKENVSVHTVYGHGGYFKTPFVGQNAVSALVGAPVTVMQNAGEGGAWGIAILALYLLDPKESLAAFLNRVFEKAEKNTVMASDSEIAKFRCFMNNYREGLCAEKALSEQFRHE